MPDKRGTLAPLTGREIDLTSTHQHDALEQFAGRIGAFTGARLPDTQPSIIDRPDASNTEQDAVVKSIISDLEHAASKRDFGILGAAVGRIIEYSLAPKVTHLRRSQLSGLIDAIQAVYAAFYPIMLDDNQQALLTNGINGVGTLVLIWTGRSKRWQPHLPSAALARDFALMLQLQVLAWAIADRLKSRQVDQQTNREAMFGQMLREASELNEDPNNGETE